MRRIAVVFTIAVIFVILGYFGWDKLHYTPPADGIPADAEPLILDFSPETLQAVPELDRCSEAIAAWVQAKLGSIQEAKVKIEYHASLDFPTASREEGIYVAGFGVPFGSKAAKMWVRCEKGNGEILCKVAREGKIGEEEFRTHAVIAVANGVYNFFMPHTKEQYEKLRKEWGYEFFRPLIRREGDRWVADCILREEK